MTRQLANESLFSDFSIWLNKEPKLQVSDGIVVLDIDFVVHRFCHWDNGFKSRDQQCMMFLETKTRGAKLRPNQADTLYMIHQNVVTSLFSFQCQGESGKFSVGHPENTRIVRSTMSGKTVQCKHYGCFLLRMEGSRPDNSGWMEWSYAQPGHDWPGKKIDAPTLVKLLRFEIHPVSFRADNPARPHKQRTQKEPSLFDSI